MAKSLGVKQIIVAMNKLENLNYDWERFTFIKSLVEDHLQRIGFKKQDISFIPISGKFVKVFIAYQLMMIGHLNSSIVPILVSFKSFSNPPRAAN